MADAVEASREPAAAQDVMTGASVVGTETVAAQDEPDALEEPTIAGAPEQPAAAVPASAPPAAMPEAAVAAAPFPRESARAPEPVLLPDAEPGGAPDHAPLAPERWVRQSVALGVTGETYELWARERRTPRGLRRPGNWRSMVIFGFVLVVSVLACVGVVQFSRLTHDFLVPLFQPAVTATPIASPIISPTIPHQ